MSPINRKKEAAEAKKTVSEAKKKEKALKSKVEKEVKDEANMMLVFNKLEARAEKAAEKERQSTERTKLVEKAMTLKPTQHLDTL